MSPLIENLLKVEATDHRKIQEEIRKNSYVLTPGRYVGVPLEEDDGILFGTKMKKLTS